MSLLASWWFNKTFGGSDMGDIEYLTTQQFNGNITRLEGDISAVTNKLTHTVASGKDGYILVVKIIPSGFVQSASRAVVGTVTTTANNHSEAKISANAIEIDRVTVGMASEAASVAQSGTNGVGIGGSGYGSMQAGKFDAAIGMKVTTGQVIEIENTLDNGNCRAQMVILEVDSGTTPKLSQI